MGGTGGGHYTAFAKNFSNNNWYEFNDAIVSPIAEKNVVTELAYILFYKRR